MTLLAAACTSAPHQLVLPHCVLLCFANTHLQTDDHSSAPPPAPGQPKKHEVRP